MASDPDSDPALARLVELAETAARAKGSVERLQDISPEDWQRVLDRVAAQAQRDGTILPDGWKKMLVRYRDGERLRSDTDDVRLAEQGEVFSREDDA
ncbi:hypothetical protein [Methylobacterium haplocladii]|uniref:Uncharacterized protein n=1 Tax=Methylobacterium haplocladii TaxID=1176176 RepID=A0A512IMW8_9HYPH|nr:hypothetical protein [Methylobacterium haplocladii]GEO99028.1 hypothetical protein MHA02_14160 [Methylobacterium haplocladii]GJD84125.1 hypothetical protein HPGCJGGD_2000 [Methylobacterium haplocladii]GLS58972.1 hypothetical protein GCM10007887_16380 [Methylobacterium haplocladii]